jgi:hypothetical protein
VVGTVAAGRTYRLRVAADAAPEPWRVRVPSGTATVCALDSADESDG